MSAASSSRIPAEVAEDHDVSTLNHDDDPKLRLIPDADEAADDRQSLPPLLAAAAYCAGPAWRLKRLRPVHASIGILASFAACLAVCAPLVPDLLREVSLSGTAAFSAAHRHLHQPPITVVTRLLSVRGHCVLEPYSKNNSSSSIKVRCSAALPSCGDLPALCRFRPGLLACQAVTPVCLVICLGLLALATFAVRRLAIQRRLIWAASAFAAAGLAATVVFVVYLHVLVGDLARSSASSTAPGLGYSTDSAGARLAYASICLQAVLACQLACLPTCLARVAAERADLLARLLG